MARRKGRWNDFSHLITPSAKAVHVGAELAVSGDWVRPGFVVADPGQNLQCLPLLELLCRPLMLREHAGDGGKGGDLAPNRRCTGQTHVVKVVTGTDECERNTDATYDRNGGGHAD